MILVDILGTLSGVLSSHKFTRVTSSPIEQMSIYLPLAIHIKWYKALGLIFSATKWLSLLPFYSKIFLCFVFLMHHL